MIERADGVFQIGSNAHNHPAEVGTALAATITAKVKAKAVADVFRPASAIVEEVLLDEIQDVPCPCLPKPEYIARAANRRRQRLRPKDPVDLDFELDVENIPDGFLRADLTERGRRHLMFATDQQLEHLARSKSWYIDGTFKLCRHPFTQLLTVNAFVKKDDHAKQVPLLFVLMSGRKKGDYRKVLKKLLEILPSAPAVQQITLDFEKAIWSALRKVIPDSKLQGCVFHWTQALWRKVRYTLLEFTQRELKKSIQSNHTASLVSNLGFFSKSIHLINSKKGCKSKGERMLCPNKFLSLS